MESVDNELENSESSAENDAESYDTGESLAPNDNPEQLTEAQRIEHARNVLGITRLTEHVRMICDHFHLPHTL